MSYWHFVLTFTLHQDSNAKISTETLMEEIKPVVSEKDEFEYGEK